MVQINFKTAPNQVLLSKDFADAYEGTFLPMTRQERGYTLHMETNAFDEGNTLGDVANAFAEIAYKKLNDVETGTPQKLEDGRFKVFNGVEGESRDVHLHASQEDGQINFTLENG